MGMTAVLTAIEEYLDTNYSPDREFVDGTVLERHLGEKSHSRVQIQRDLLSREALPETFHLAGATGEDHAEPLPHSGRLRHSPGTAQSDFRSAAADLH